VQSAAETKKMNGTGALPGYAFVRISAPQSRSVRADAHEVDLNAAVPAAALDHEGVFAGAERESAGRVNGEDIPPLGLITGIDHLEDSHRRAVDVNGEDLAGRSPAVGVTDRNDVSRLVRTGEEGPVPAFTGGEVKCLAPMARERSRTWPSPLPGSAWRTSDVGA